MLKSLRTRRFLKESDIRARMWPAWYYLILIRATDKFDMRARERPAWPPGTGMLKRIGFPMNPQERAQSKHEDVWLKNHLVLTFLC